MSVTVTITVTDSNHLLSSKSVLTKITANTTPFLEHLVRTLLDATVTVTLQNQKKHCNKPKLKKRLNATVTPTVTVTVKVKVKVMVTTRSRLVTACQNLISYATVRSP